MGELRMDISGLDLEHLNAAIDEAEPEALAQGMEHIRSVSAPLVPVETGRLVGSATVHVEGDTASLTYDGPYARYQEFRLDLRHEHGQANYLGQPMQTEPDAVMEIIAHRIQEAL